MILQNETGLTDTLKTLSLPDWIFFCIALIVVVILFIVWLIIVVVIAALITDYLESKKVIHYRDRCGMITLIIFIEALISFFILICLGILIENPNPLGIILYQRLVPCMLLP